MIRRIIFTLCVVLLVVAYAGPNIMYNCVRYELTRFVHYHDSAVKKEALQKYIAFVETGGTPEHPIAPGLFAEAGTFMLEEGDVPGAIKFYQMESDAWPEARPMLSVLISNLEARVDE